MSRMLDAEELDLSFGQTDSLTHRLNTLLQDYTDGFAGLIPYCDVIMRITVDVDTMLLLNCLPRPSLLPVFSLAGCGWA